ncbi:MAG: thiol:disulfide interchange protein DsbA/DsbL [Gammaproteobacteria bacterium]
MIRTLLLSIALVAALPLAAAEPVQLAQAGSQFQEGRHYRVLKPAQPTSVAPGKVEVVEVFWYGCPHCFSLEPYIQRWLEDGKPAAAEFVKMPASLNPSWQPGARLFYAADALGVLDQAHTDIFREMHVSRRPLNTLDAMVEFLTRYGVSEEQAREALTSFAVVAQMRKADTMARRYRLTGVPAVVVNGKYVTGADMAGGPDALFQVVNYLVDREASAE